MNAPRRTMARDAILLALILTVTGAQAAPPETDEAAADDARRVHLDFALMPIITVQQVEGPVRDDLLTRDMGLATYLSGTYAVLDWLEPGLLVQLDVGQGRRAAFSRPDASGVAQETAVVEGSWWELWVTLMVRARWEALFVEVGWSPLVLRRDEARGDLPNTDGASGGTFLGSRSVAWSLAIGGRVPLSDALDLTLRLQFRIRYLVERDGKPLADGEESGQMLLWPLIGLHTHF